MTQSWASEVATSFSCFDGACPPLQIKPFVLRRTKDQVLSDLPPKILQDVYVDASPLQVLRTFINALSIEHWHAIRFCRTRV